MDFNIHFAAKRTLDRLLRDNSDKTMHVRSWKEEAERLSAEYAADYEELKKIELYSSKFSSQFNPGLNSFVNIFVKSTEIFVEKLE